MRAARYAMPRFVAACLLAVLPWATGCALNTPVLQRGANERMGVLLNYSCGAHVCDPIDPCKPTIVITHGWNPLPERIRCTFGPSGAAALKCRCGDSYNILSWDWNAVHVPALHDEPIRIGKEQGRKMAAALRARGVVPGRTQIIAHSLGTLATAQAAACMSDLGCFAQLTLLDSPTSMHEEIFHKLCITHHARRVENYWAPGVAGYGGHVSLPGVQNYIVRGEHPILGIVDLSRSSHVHVMEWYYWTMRCPDMRCGFQNSVFVRCCGRGDASGTPMNEGPVEPPIETADQPVGDMAELGPLFESASPADSTADGVVPWQEIAAAPREIAVR